MATVSRYFMTQSSSSQKTDRMSIMNTSNCSIEHLQSQWKEMYQTRLPAAAAVRSVSQSSWPVHKDHCFARIILDNTIGIDQPWTTRLESPAYKNMSREQLAASIELGRKILDGKVDLVKLDEKSLKMRGKAKKLGGKRKVVVRTVREEESEVFGELKRRKLSPPGSEALHLLDEPMSPAPSPAPSQSTLPNHPTTLTTLPTLPAHAQQLTPFRHLVLTTLLQVPHGSYTTYGLLASHLNSSPRAVGNALRNNPFAPQVPCHRVLASGGGLGGFKGSWGRGKEGVFDGEKRRLLRAEGVRFDGGGRVVGSPWGGFK